MILQDLATRIPTLGAFFTDDGVVPRSALTERWARGLFDLVGSLTGVGVLWALGCVATIAMTLGLRTRISTFCTWLFLMSMHNRNLFIVDGGDDLAKVLLFWSLFTDLGACWSLDARRRGEPRCAPALGARLLSWQIAFLYFAAMLDKVRGSGNWLTGESLYQALQMTGFVRPPGAWLLTHPELCRLLTWSTLVCEAALPVLIVTPFVVGWSRTLAILLGGGLQLGILLTMRVGIFSGLMLCTCLLFLRPVWLDELRLARLPVLTPPPEPQVRLGAVVVAALVLLHFAFAVMVGVFPSTPPIIETELKYVGLHQGVDLFGRTYPIGAWRGIGELADGTTAEVLPLTIPELQPQPAYLYSKWVKFSYKRKLLGPPLGDYICRRYNARVSGPRLVSLRLERDLRPPDRPGYVTPPGATEIVVQQPCPASDAR